jgi:hypothetical protein
MSEANKVTRSGADWNVLTHPWLDVMNCEGRAQVVSPLDALKQAGKIRCVALASPLDRFASYRFLLTLLHWKADVSKGVGSVREALLRGEVLRAVLDGIEAETSRFRLFDYNAPFLQDPTACEPVPSPSSAASLFAEFASGTNVAHFHHGDDSGMRLCVQCATIGMLRLVPWSQSGGRGLTPSIHGAPPIMALAFGPNLAVTLGLNLVPLGGKAGIAKWTGHFRPSEKAGPIPYLEAFTWNPRRVHLLLPKEEQVCWACGRQGVAAVGPIVYLKNEATKKRSDGEAFDWRDPAAFYDTEKPRTTTKSWREECAMNNADLSPLADREDAPKSLVVEQNPDHGLWHLSIPCTNPANNKSFDHRELVLPALSPDAVRLVLPLPEAEREGLDGWADPARTTRIKGAAQFVRMATRTLTPADWTVLSTAVYQRMHDSPAAFDILTGLYWGLRGRVTGLPSRGAAWLLLKLMASVPAAARELSGAAFWNPLRNLRKRQPDERRRDRTVRSPYPVSLPRGHQLEAAMLRALDRNRRKRAPDAVDWAGLCHDLGQLSV